jgi:2-aminoethylphosphonate-pyruvate transaminase
MKRKQSFKISIFPLDLVIYPGKVTKAPCFRIGHIGDLNASDMENLISGIKVVLKEMGVQL